MESETLKEALSRRPAGVVVVSAAHEGGFRGLTATSFTPVSMDPPLVLVCIEHFTTTGEAIRETGAFNVSQLSIRQEFVAERFAGRAPMADAAWREIPHRLASNGLPILEGSVAWFQCGLEEIHPAGDHEIVIGRVNDAGVSPGEPLIHWDRAFWRVANF